MAKHAKKTEHLEMQVKWSGQTHRLIRPHSTQEESNILKRKSPSNEDESENFELPRLRVSYRLTAYKDIFCRKIFADGLLEQRKLNEIVNSDDEEVDDQSKMQRKVSNR